MKPPERFTAATSDLTIMISVTSAAPEAIRAHARRATASITESEGKREPAKSRVMVQLEKKEGINRMDRMNRIMK
jgi:hypothetical protein